MSISLGLAFSLLSSTIAARPADPPVRTGLQAMVNDTRSHGTVGDNFLSLDEGIRLANGTLSLALLSAAELAQVAGTGLHVDEVVVDAAVVPAITVEAPLTGLVGMASHAHGAMVLGIASGGVRPVLQGGTHAFVLAIREHTAHVEGLRIAGGQVGIDVRTANSGVSMHQMAMVMDCEIDGQTVAAVKLFGTGTEHSGVMVMDTDIRNAPVGFLLDDQTNGGWLMVEGEGLLIDGVAIGTDVVENGRMNMSMFMLFRSTFRNGATLGRMRKTTASSQQFMFRYTFVDAECTGDVLDVQGNSVGLTMVHFHHGDFVTAPGRKAFFVWPRTAEVDVHGSEMTLAGDVSIAGNLFSPRIWVQNCQIRDGAVTFDVDGAPPNLLWNTFRNCSVTVASTARAPARHRQSEFFSTPLTGNSVFAPMTLDGCYRTGSAMTGQVSETNAAPMQFLGTAAVTPVEPRVGTSVRVSLDLPYAIGGIWDAAVSFPRPVTTQEPVRFYGDPATLVVLPGLVVFRSSIDIPVPNAPNLVGTEFYFQPIALPLLAQPWAPAYHLPRGGLVRPVL